MVDSLKSDGSDEKVYAFADGDRELKKDLAGLHKSDQVLSHLKDQGYRTTRTYVEYQGWLRKRTNLRGKAIDMFNQTVAVKDIQSLNAFIRSHMLGAFEWRDKVDRLLKHFSDLSLAYQELVRAKRRGELLQPVADIGDKFQRQAAELEQLERQISAAGTFFPFRTIELFEPEIATQEEVVDVMSATIKRLDDSLQSTRETVRQLTNEIELAGGERLKQIFGFIQIEETHRHHKRLAFGRFRDNLKTCRIEGDIVNQERFEQARQHLRTRSDITWKCSRRSGFAHITSCDVGPDARPSHASRAAPAPTVYPSR